MVTSRCARAVYALRAARVNEVGAEECRVEPRQQRFEGARVGRRQDQHSRTLFAEENADRRDNRGRSVTSVRRSWRARRIVLEVRARAAGRGVPSRKARPSRAPGACSRRARRARWRRHRRAGAPRPRRRSAPAPTRECPSGVQSHRFLAVTGRGARCCGARPRFRARPRVLARLCTRPLRLRRPFLWPTAYSQKAGTRSSNRSRRRRCRAARPDSPCPS